MTRHDFRIELEAPNRWRTFIDGQRMSGVKSVQFSAAIDHMPTVTITFNAGQVIVDGVADVSEADGDGKFRKFEKVA